MASSAGKLLYFRTNYSLLTQEYVGWRPVTLVMVCVRCSRGGLQTKLWHYVLKTLRSVEEERLAGGTVTLNMDFQPVLPSSITSKSYSLCTQDMDKAM